MFKIQSIDAEGKPYNHEVKGYFFFIVSRKSDQIK